MMDFLKLLKPGKSDPFGIDGSIDANQQLHKRRADEEGKLAGLKDEAQKAFLAGAEFDEMVIIRQERRIAIIVDAIETATQEAAARLDQKMPEIRDAIADLEQKQRALKEKRDRESVKVVADFLIQSGGTLAEMPRRGHGGLIRIPATAALDLEDVQELLEDLPAPGHPAPTPTSDKLDEIRRQLHKLTILKHYGSRTGLETLCG